MASDESKSQSGGGIGGALRRCANSRTKEGWAKLGGAYTIFYAFLACWMACLMAIYTSTNADTCVFRNGDNFCIGEPKFGNLIDAALVIRKSDQSVTVPCTATGCTGNVRFQINNDFKLREVPAGKSIEVTCTSTLPANVEFSGCQTSAPATLARIEGADGDVTTGRTCDANAGIFTFGPGSKLPYDAVLEVTGNHTQMPLGSATIKCAVSTNIARDFSLDTAEATVRFV
jgi:hypothetical protein